MFGAFMWNQARWYEWTIIRASKEDHVERI
jgi:hypothetical protein